jgi:hypothetical protein
MAIVWVRVRDKVTGHHYDVTVGRLEMLLERDAVEEIPNRRHRGKSRPPKALKPLPLPAPQSSPAKTAKPAGAITTAIQKGSESA